MHSGFRIPEMEHQQQLALLLSMNQTHVLEQIHGTLPATHQLLLDPPLFLPPHHHHSRLSHQCVGGAATDAPSSHFPINVKLGFNEIRSSSDSKHGTVFSCINEGEDALFHGREARHSSLGVPHCWQNRGVSAIKQQPFWESLTAEMSNDKSDTVDRQKDIEMNQKEALNKYCLGSKSKVLHGELEAVCKHVAMAEGNQTGPHEVTPSEASIGDEATASPSTKDGKRKRKKMRKETSYCNDQFISPMAQFFEQLVNQMMYHQENFQRKFSEVMERLDEERRERDVAWRNQELAHFEQEADARALEKALAAGREATIVSYLEKITGNLSSTV